MQGKQIDGVGDYRNAEGLITRMLSEHNGFKHGDTASVDLLALTQVAEFMAEAMRRAPSHELKKGHELLTYIIDNLKEV